MELSWKIVQSFASGMILISLVVATNVDPTHGAYTSAGKTTLLKGIQVEPVRGLWKVFEAPNVEPVFGGEDGRSQSDQLCEYTAWIRLGRGPSTRRFRRGY